MADSHMLDVVVRFHDVERVSELRRCLFSLACQSYRPITVHIATQRFTAEDTLELEKTIAPILAIDPDVSVRIWNYTEPQPVDARSALLNLGISKATGRYLALLDHDDTIYPEGYRLLTHELHESGAGIAFGGIVSKVVEVFQDAVLTESRKRKYVGHSLIELFVDNFCPIHSFVVDRSVVEADDLWFSAEMTRLEDYDFLLRITAKYVSSFRLMDRAVGDYYFKKDGTNTTCLGWNDSFERRLSWDVARKAIQERRRTTLVSSVVQKAMGYRNAIPDMTIEKVLKNSAPSTLVRSLGVG